MAGRLPGLWEDKPGYRAAVTVLVIVGVCVLLLILGFLVPRLSRRPQGGVLDEDPVVPELDPHGRELLLEAQLDRSAHPGHDPRAAARTALDQDVEARRDPVRIDVAELDPLLVLLGGLLRCRLLAGARL